MSNVNRPELLAQLARREITQEKLAQRLAVRPSTFSSWVRGINPAPKGFTNSVEDALGLRRGTLKERQAA